MLKGRFQGGPFVEVFSAQGRNPASEWKLSGTGTSIRREYDKEVKSFVYVLEGGPTLTKMSLPKDEKQCLGLVQPFVVFQLYVSHGQSFSIDLTVSDISKSKRHIFMSSSHKELSWNPLHARIPLATLNRGVWLNFCVDLVSLVRDVFRGETFNALERITVSAACKIRKIFTLKSQPAETAAVGVVLEQENVSHLIPKNLQIPSADITVLTQVFSILSLQPAHSTEAAVRSAVSSAASRRSATESKRAHRFQQPKALSASRKRSGRKQEQRRVPAPAMSSRDQPLSQLPIANGDPHPVLPSPVVRQSPPVDKELPPTDEAKAQASHFTNSQTNCDLSDSVTNQHDTQADGVGINTKDSFDQSLYSYVSPPHSARHRRPAADVDISMPMNDVWPSVESEDELNSSHGTNGSLRGAAFDGDFYSGGEASEEDVMEDGVSRLRMEQKEKSVERQDECLQILMMNQTRLSDDYDWRNYESSSTSGTTSSVSGLPGRPLDQSFDVSIADDDGGDSLDSSEGEDSYRAVSVNWQPEHASAHSQPSNPRAMGGMLSPPIPLQQPSLESQFEDSNEQQHANGTVKRMRDASSETDSEEELEVLYDPCLNCYYDPKTHKYYELA